MLSNAHASHRIVRPQCLLSESTLTAVAIKKHTEYLKHICQNLHKVLRTTLEFTTH